MTVSENRFELYLVVKKGLIEERKFIKRTRIFWNVYDKI